MPLSAYMSPHSQDALEDLGDALSDLEKKLCQHFRRLEIAGKRGRKVPVLLTPAMQEALDLLVSKREMCGVVPGNKYLFARPKACSYFRGSDCLRHFAKMCGAKNPESLTSTKLRKQTATLSQVLNLSNTELDQLADFLGHDVRVHRQFYRLPEGTLQLAKVSKILMALEQGRMAEFKGKGLDDITIDPEGKDFFCLSTLELQQIGQAWCSSLGQVLSHSASWSLSSTSTRLQEILTLSPGQVHLTGPTALTLCLLEPLHHLHKAPGEPHTKSRSGAPYWAMCPDTLPPGAPPPPPPGEPHTKSRSGAPYWANCTDTLPPGASPPPPQDHALQDSEDEDENQNIEEDLDAEMPDETMKHPSLLQLKHPAILHCKRSKDRHAPPLQLAGQS
ncbi:hypothetical protein WMY93_001452 [Mugilogobius chulae]|uniref:Uncharacterized protein n=1 Tax=Mugilogobius chulae TaxID=88201 RepID=A0AAW0QH85_9GOBI